MSDLTIHTQNTKVREIVSQAQALGFKLPAALQAKLSRAAYLTDLVREVTPQEIANATDEDMPELVERIARNASFQAPTAQVALGKFRDTLDQDLYNTLRASAEDLYNAVAKKLDKEFDKITSDACAVPYEFAANPALWERQTREAIDAYKRLRVSIPKAAPLVNLLHAIAVTFLPPLPVSQWELKGLGNLHVFYNFNGQTSPTLAQLRLPEKPLVSLETVVYLAKRNIFLNAQSVEERHTTEQALIDQALTWTQVDDKWMPANEAPEIPQGLMVPVAYPGSL